MEQIDERFKQKIESSTKRLRLIGNLIIIKDITDSFKFIGVLFDKKVTFEKHLRFVAFSIAHKVGILKKCFCIHDSILQNCFFSFILPLFEYCAPV